MASLKLSALRHAVQEAEPAEGLEAVPADNGTEPSTEESLIPVGLEDGGREVIVLDL
jgi:hypothetical protein